MICKPKRYVFDSAVIPCLRIARAKDLMLRVTRMASYRSAVAVSVCRADSLHVGTRSRRHKLCFFAVKGTRKIAGPARLPP